MNGIMKYRSARNTGRASIERIKGYIKDCKEYFDGDGYYFKKALSECRNEGINIVFDKMNLMYKKVTHTGEV